MKETRKKMEQLLFSNLNKNQIASKLLEIAEEKLLVKRVVYKYKSNGFYSTIFNEQEVESELYITITNVMNALERYNGVKSLILKKQLLESKLTKGEFESLSETPSVNATKKATKLLGCTPEAFIETLKSVMAASNGDLLLDTEAHLTGYLIVAFQNNIRRIYAKYKTNKREFTEMIQLDAHFDKGADMGHVKNRMESLGSVNPMEERDYSQAIVEMAKFLKGYDKKQNSVNSNQKSQLAKLFCSIVNPKKVEDNDELRKRFGWSQYLLNKNKEVLVRKLQEEFSDAKEDILVYLDNREAQNKAS